MTQKVRTEAARLAVQAAGCLDDHVNAATVFSLAIMFESWILNGADETQAKLKILPEEGAQVVKLVRPGPVPPNDKPGAY